VNNGHSTKITNIMVVCKGEHLEDVRVMYLNEAEKVTRKAGNQNVKNNQQRKKLRKRP